MSCSFGETPVPVGCVVMASGLGRRFQREGAPYRSKLLAEFMGRPLLGHVLALTDGLPLAARTAVTRSPEAAAYCRAQGVDAVLHGLPHRSDTVRLGLDRAEELSALPLAGCMFCPADQPLLRRESVAALLASFAREPERIHRLCWQDRPGSPAVFPRRLFGQLRRLPAGEGGSFLIRKYPDQVRYVPVGEAWELMDADTGEDLLRLGDLAAGREEKGPPKP